MVSSSSKEEMREKPEQVGKSLDGDEEKARYAHVGPWSALPWTVWVLLDL